MMDDKLEFAKRYSFGDNISREGFEANEDSTIIARSDKEQYNVPHYHITDSIFLGKNQIYCSRNNIWAVIINKTESNYEIY